jgi:hypothetical protein
MWGKIPTSSNVPRIHSSSIWIASRIVLKWQEFLMKNSPSWIWSIVYAIYVSLASTTSAFPLFAGHINIESSAFKSLSFFVCHSDKLLLKTILWHLFNWMHTSLLIALAFSTVRISHFLQLLTEYLCCCHILNNWKSPRSHSKIQVRW